jgi:hypothetical protein
MNATLKQIEQQGKGGTERFTASNRLATKSENRRDLIGVFPEASKEGERYIAERASTR